MAGIMAAVGLVSFAAATYAFSSGDRKRERPGSPQKSDSKRQRTVPSDTSPFGLPPPSPQTSPKKRMTPKRTPHRSIPGKSTPSKSRKYRAKVPAKISTKKPSPKR